MAGTTVVFFFSQSGSSSQNGLTSEAADAVEATDIVEDGMKTVSFKMEHCDCTRYQIFRWRVMQEEGYKTRTILFKIIDFAEKETIFPELKTSIYQRNFG